LRADVCKEQNLKEEGAETKEDRDALLIRATILSSCGVAITTSKISAYN
jgi:hypothetical protein